MPRWTEEQTEAIYKTGTNIIVSAGAGSGKTAVLTTRVIEKLKTGIHINELLILTFTKAAASEMKERIRKEIKKEPLLKDELDLIDSSYITTFDSYALSVVKKYNYLLNVSSNISIVEQSIIDIEKKKILDNIFEDYYTKEDSKFIKLINDFCIKDDESIKNSLLKITNQLSMKTNKQEYINNYLENNFNELKINNDINEYIKLINNKKNSINDLLYNLSCNVLGDYYTKIEDILNPLLDSNTYIDIKNNLNIKLPQMPSNSTEEAKQIKNDISSIIKELINMCIYENIDEIKETIYLTKDYIDIILEIIKEFNKQIDEYKFNNDLYEFNDIAHMALQVLNNNEALKEIKDSFKEILVDEYQDTNDIQEEFISKLENNNVYMVGDIKQSIYCFRNANPYIFKQKYDEYSKLNGGIKIDLNKNFRSRKEVLDNINQIFNLIMDDNIGGANYIKTHQMIFGNNTYLEKGSTNQNNNLEIYSYNYDSSLNYNKEEIEAFLIAKDIKDKVKDNYQVFDKDNQVLRNITYNDFVILMDRTTNFDLYKKIFEYNEIPLTLLKDEKLTNESDIYVIKNIIKFILKVKENQIDTEFKYLFISIMRSFLIREDDNIIFNYFKDESFKESDLYKKVLQFIPLLDHISNKELLEKIINDFNFYEKLITVGNINASLIRIDKLLDSAKSTENMGYTIYDFSNYLNEIIENDYDIKYSLNESNNDSVKIMTIHKSKGLEYHICYYAGIYKEFNISDLKERFIFDNNYGLIVPYFKEGIGSTIYKDLLKDKHIKEEISEKIRLFYVALTRSKEKMIIIEPSKEETEMYKNIDGVIENNIRLKYRSFKHIMDSIKKEINAYYKVIDINNINLTKNYNLNKNIEIKNIIPTNNTKILTDELKIDNELLSKNTFSKKQNNLSSKDQIINLEFGKKIHEIFELIDFKNPSYENIDDNIKSKIINLLNQDIMKNIKQANILKEYEFIYDDNNTQYHGIIDLMLEYKNHIDIIDYKLKNIEDDNYLKQLNGYKNYIELKTNKKTNIYLYSILDNQIKKID